MEITSTSFIRSLRNEAGRQADFFRSRDGDVADTWRQIESIAHNALLTGSSLRIILSSELTEYPIHKACE